MMMIMMISVEQWVECLAGETEVLGENLHQCRFVSRKSQKQNKLVDFTPQTNYTD
jgi:hypothetical protein